MTRKVFDVDVNRVEGDLKISVEVDENQTVTNAWSVGTMYRGFEQLLLGRDATDSLVITPRVCGICSTSHLYASVSALESALGCRVPPNATRIRNAALMAENIQSDTRHAFLIYLVEFAHKRYSDNPWYREVKEALAPLEGRLYREAIAHTKKIVEIVAILGGQWPHSSYMIPGGVTTVLNKRDIIKAMGILDSYQRWYEDSVMGMSADDWLSLHSRADFERRLEQDGKLAYSAVGLFARFGRSLGLEGMGLGEGRLLSGGCYYDPEGYDPSQKKSAYLFNGGYYDGNTGSKEDFAHEHITEHVKFSWFVDYEGGRHPWQGETIPDFRADSHKYSWAKAPRYKDRPVELGPLAELVLADDPLMKDFFAEQGSTAWLRQLARFHRPIVTMNEMRRQLQDLLKNIEGDSYIRPQDIESLSGEGVGLVNAARGSLGHWLRVKDGKIDKYQIITPTTWNASPRDEHDQPGHFEHSLLGTRIEDLDDPLEVGHIIRSHDPCLVCTVHFLDNQKSFRYRV